MDNLSILFSDTMLMSAIRLSIPLGLAAVGTTICEKTGVINLGIEGMMLLGAFTAVLGVHLSGNPYMGVFISILAGMLVGLFYALIVIKFNSDQSVSGIGLNIFASGITVVSTRAIWKSDGLSGEVLQVPNITIPLLSDIPVIGVFFKNQSPYLYATIIIVCLSYYMIYKTKIGLRLRSIGSNKEAAMAAGINVKKYTYVAIMICGMLCALGGSYISIVQNNRFVNNMVAGRGFMAIAANIFGNNNPIGSYLSSFLFAFAQALRINLNVNIPDQFLQMLPYVATLLVLTLIYLKNLYKLKKKNI